MEEEGSCSPATRLCPHLPSAPLPALPLSLLSPFQGRNTSIKGTCSPLQSTTCSFFAQPHGRLTEIVWFVWRNRGDTHLTQQSLANLPRYPTEAAPGHSHRWGRSPGTHPRIICSIWDLQCFSKISPLILFQIKISSNFGVRTATSKNTEC